MGSYRGYLRCNNLNPTCDGKLARGTERNFLPLHIWKQAAHHVPKVGRSLINVVPITTVGVG